MHDYSLAIVQHELMIHACTRSGGSWISLDTRGGGGIVYSIISSYDAITDKTWDKIIIYRALIYKAAPSLHQLRFQLKQHGHNLLLKGVEYNISYLLFQLLKAKRKVLTSQPVDIVCKNTVPAIYTKGQTIHNALLAMYVHSCMRGAHPHHAYAYSLYESYNKIVDRSWRRLKIRSLTATACIQSSHLMSL